MYLQIFLQIYLNFAAPRLGEILEALFIHVPFCLHVTVHNFFPRFSHYQIGAHDPRGNAKEFSMQIEILGH